MARAKALMLATCGTEGMLRGRAIAILEDDLGLSRRLIKEYLRTLIDLGFMEEDLNGVVRIREETNYAIKIKG